MFYAKYDIYGRKRWIWERIDAGLAAAVIMVGLLLYVLYMMVKLEMQDPGSLSRMGVSPSNDGRAMSALSAMGMKDVSFNNDYGVMLKCGEDDSVLMSKSFSATSISGQRVSGVVCCGHFKGCTVRF